MLFTLASTRWKPRIAFGVGWAKGNKTGTVTNNGKDGLVDARWGDLHLVPASRAHK